MADTKISALPAAGSVADANEFAINEAGTSKKVTAAQIATHANAAHLADATDAHDASAVSNVPVGTITAVDVQGAIDQLENNKAGLVLQNQFSANATVFGSGTSTGYVWVGPMGDAHGYVQARADSGNANLFLMAEGTGWVESLETFRVPSVMVPYAQGSFIVPTGRFNLWSKQLALAGAERATVEGTARLHGVG